MSTPLVSSSVNEHIGTITIHSKTMPPKFFDELEAVVLELTSDEQVRAIVVRSDTTTFSYGLDLKAAFAEFGDLFTKGGLGGERERLRKLVKKLQSPLSLLADSPAPVICAIHGHCIGGGLDLATACDIRVASADATFSLRETKIAMVADIGSLQRLPRIVGAGHAREMAFTGKDIDANRALSMGLVNYVHEDREATWEGANALAAEIASNSPLAVRGVKSVLRFSEEHSIAEGLDYVSVWNSAFLASGDLAEAMTAFLSKRPPVFTGN